MRVKRNRSLFLAFCMFALFFSTGCDGIKKNAKVKFQTETYTVFDAGDNDVNSYRIPSIVATPNGTLLVFCEARRESWKDKSRTDIVVKRSVDGGKTWSPMYDLTQGTTGAYMDPTPVIDNVTGRIFLFTTFWPADNHSGSQNKAFLITSDDDGETWSTAKDITDELLPEGKTPNGFGPGSGLQMRGDVYKERLILPIRIADADGKGTHDAAAYSDDHGITWQIGEAGDDNNEFQIAESPFNTLIYNARVANGRMVSRSVDGGLTWTKSVKDASLPGVSKGCQASMLGQNETLYFTGIQGIPETDEFDERARLALYTSTDGGNTWDEGMLLYEKASGYSCITDLPDGRLAIVFETADTPAFTRKSIVQTVPPKRPAGWMRLDVIIVTN